MKKTIWLFLLILCLPVVVNAGSAKIILAEDATPKNCNNTWCAVPNNLFYMLEGKYEDMKSMKKTYRGVRVLNGKEVTFLRYNAQLHAISYNNTRYNSICIDPGLANSGGNFTCQKIEMSDYSDDQVKYINSLKYLLTNYLSMQHEDYLKAGPNRNYNVVIGVQLAVRAYAYQARLGVNNNETNGAKIADNRLMTALSNRIALGITTGSTMGEGLGDDYTLMTYDYSASPLGDNFIGAAVSYYNEAKDKVIDDASEIKLKDSKLVNNLTAKYFSYKIESSSDNLDISKFTISGNLDGNEFTLKCSETCKNNNISFTYSGKVGILKVDGIEKFDIDVIYNEDNSVTSNALYICYKKNADFFSTTNQKFLTLIPEPIETAKVHISQHHSVTCDCTNYEKEPKKQISMCCTDNAESYVIQPTIDQIFCDKTSTTLRVAGYVNKCPDLYKVSSAENNLSSGNSYCELYCSERITITVPNSVQGNNGKYFKLESVENHPDSTGPYLKGKRTCRMVTHYDDWVNDYKTKSGSTVTHFNTYQEYQAYHDMYELMYNSNIKNKTAYGKSDHTESRTIYYKGEYEDPCDSTKPKKTVYCSEQLECTVNYTAHITSDSYTNVTYQQAKLVYSSNNSTNNDSIRTYKGFYITSGNSKTTTDGPQGYYETQWASDTCGKTSTSSKSCYVPATTCPKNDGTNDSIPIAGHYVTSYYNGISSGSPSNIESAISDKMKDYSASKVTEKANAYNDDVNALNTHEGYLDECSNYFVENADGTPNGKGTERNNDADQSYKLYKLYPTINFVYFTTYLDSNNESKVNDKKVPFDNIKCTYKMTDMKDQSNTELGLEGYHYNEYNPNKFASVTNFNVSAELDSSCLNNSSLCTSNKTLASFLDSSAQVHSQRYTNDAYYEAECSTNPSSSTNSYVIYPFGSITTTYSNNSLASYHDSQYFIEYSSFRGSYETYWTFDDLGTNGKKVFDNYFKASSDSLTCSKTDSGKLKVSEKQSDGKYKDIEYNSYLTCHLNISSSLTRLSGCDSSAVISLISNSSNNWNQKCCGKTSLIGKCDVDDVLSFAFKTVDPVNLFPDDGVVNNGITEYASNWLKGIKNVPSTSVKDEIETRAAKDLTFDSSRISYEFNLTIKDLELIRDYNSKNDYNDFKLTCKEIKNGDKTVGYYDCQSAFITNYYNGKIITDGDHENAYGIAKLQSARSTGTDAKRHIWPK